MSSYTVTFEQVTARATRTGNCPTCGKRVSRSRTFLNTVSPFNCNPDGTVRTWAEVQAAVQVKADAWDPGQDVFEHQRCYDERVQPRPERCCDYLEGGHGPLMCRGGE